MSYTTPGHFCLCFQIFVCLRCYREKHFLYNITTKLLRDYENSFAESIIRIVYSGNIPSIPSVMLNYLNYEVHLLFAIWWKIAVDYFMFHSINHKIWIVTNSIDSLVENYFVIIYSSKLLMFQQVASSFFKEGLF